MLTDDLTAPLRPPILEALLLAYARAFPLRRGKVRTVNALWRLAAGRSGSKRVARLNFSDFVMRCDLGEMLQRQFYYFGTYLLEDELLDCWSDVALASQVVFDVGANAGIYSLAALAARPSAEVHAFEPTPEIAEALRETAAVNGLDRLHVQQLAVTDRPGQLFLHRFRGDSGDNGGMNYVWSEPDSAQQEPVDAVSLDGFCERQGIDRIDLMKLDIQGHEPSALAGARRLLADGRIGTLFMELNWEEGREDGPAPRAIAILEDAGYQFAVPARRLDLRPSGDWLRALSDVVVRRPANGVRSA